MKTKLMTNQNKSSYKLIILFGDIIKTKIFEGKDAYKRAIQFQKWIVDLSTFAKSNMWYEKFKHHYDN